MLPVIPIVKVGVSLVASAGVNKIATQIIRNNTVVVTTVDKILIGAGSLAVTSMLAEATHNHIDRFVEGVRDYRKKDTPETDAIEEA